MKKTIAVLIAVAALVLSVPAISGCGEEASYTLSEEGGKHYIVDCSSGTGRGEFVIPAYFGEGEDYAPVTEIASEGFAGTDYSKIHVPATIEKIGNAAFAFCNLLESVEFEEGSGIEEISHGAFGNSTALKEVRLPESVKKIGALAFTGCTNLASVELPEVEYIGIRAFENCTALESVVLPDTLKQIDERAFVSCGLKSITIPDSVSDTYEEDTLVRGLGFGAFEDCVSLESATIGEGITVISSGAFGYCIALKEVYIPISVKEIDGAYYENNKLRYAHPFYSNIAMTDVYFEGSEEQWNLIKIATDTRSEGGVTIDNKALLNAQKHYNYAKN